MTEKAFAQADADWLELIAGARSWFSGPLGGLLLCEEQRLLEDELARYFGQVEAHFSAKADAAKGVEFSRKSQAHANAIATAVEAGNYDAAMDALTDLTRSCRTCHEVYKKPK